MRLHSATPHGVARTAAIETATPTHMRRGRGDADRAKILQAIRPPRIALTCHRCLPPREFSESMLVVNYHSLTSPKRRGIFLGFELNYFACATEYGCCPPVELHGSSVGAHEIRREKNVERFF